MATIIWNTKGILFILNMERLVVPNAYCGTLRKFWHAIQNKPYRLLPSGIVVNFRLQLESSNVVNSFTETFLFAHSTALFLYFVTNPCLHIKQNDSNYSSLKVMMMSWRIVLFNSSNMGVGFYDNGIRKLMTNINVRKLTVTWKK